jgi:hypothetical protein
VTATAAPKITELSRQSLDRLREMVVSGTFGYAARVDRQTGEIVDPEARALFASLPAVTPATIADELVENGLLRRAPKDLHRAFDQPKYRPGRELFVRTTVSFAEQGRRGTGFFDPTGEPAFTHRAVLRGQRGEELRVDVEGAPAELTFARSDIFAWNQPCGLPAAGGTLSGVQIDYNNPLFKAHVCAGYLDVAEALEELDFSGDAEKVRRTQEKLIHRLASRVRMAYAGRGDGYGGHRGASLLDGGHGVCFVQRAVAGAYLQAFARVLAFEVQIAHGRTLRLGVPHGFVVLVLRPSLKRFVCDPAWAEPLTDLKVAFFDSGWGHDRRLDGFEGTLDQTVRPAEVDLPEEGA